MITTPFQFGTHWFNVGGFLTEEALLRQLPTLKTLGVKLLDLPAGMIDKGLDINRLGDLLVAYAMEARFCVFHTGYDSIDGGEGQKKGFAAIRSAAELCSGLMRTSYGSMFSAHRPSLTGPIIGSIGVDYGYGSQALIMAERAMKEILPVLDSNGTVANLELIRPKENRLFAGLMWLMNVMDAVGSDRLLLHPDTFHMDLWGELDEQTFKKIGPRVGHFHTSGTLRQTPGFGLDKIKWAEVTTWVKTYCTNPLLRFMVLEGFCPEFRDLVPEIGAEFPKDLEPMTGVTTAFTTLADAGAFTA
jgi:sugar phosphate isomerase/epimerase